MSVFLWRPSNDSATLMTVCMFAESRLMPFPGGRVGGGVNPPVAQEVFCLMFAEESLNVRSV